MPVVELRQYTLHPGRRDDLVNLFERAFIESQEADGMTLLGQFRDLDDPDRFVWLRAFPDMEARLRSLQAFYSGPVWQAHRNAANATMIDSDDVLLLKPLDAADIPLRPRAHLGATGPGRGAAVCGVHRLSGPDDALPARFRAETAPRLAAHGLTPVVVLVTDDSPNTFPALPVREGEDVLAWVALAPDQPAADAVLAAARADPALGPVLDDALQLLRLQPTARSRLHD